MAQRAPEAPEDRNYTQEYYDDKLNRVNELRQLEKLNNLRDNHPDAVSARAGLAGASNEDIQNQEESPTYAGTWENKTSPNNSGGERQGRTSRIRSFLRMNKRKGAIGGASGLLIAASLFGFSFFGMYVGPFAAVANMTLDLSDPLSAVQNKSENLLAKKVFKSPLLSDPDGFGAFCGGIAGKLPVKCRYGVASKKLIDKLNYAGIEVIETAKFGPIEVPQRFRMDNMEFNPEGLRQYLRENPSANLRYRQAFNQNWLMMRGSTYVRGVLRKFNVNNAVPDLSGTVEENAEKLKSGDTRSTIPDIDTGKLVPARNENGEIILDDAGNQLYAVETGEVKTLDDGTSFRVTDNSNTIDQTKFNELEGVLELDVPDESSRKNPVSAMKPSAARTALMSANLLGGTEAACTARNMIGKASVMSKVYNKRHLIKYAMPILAAAGALQAGDLSAEQAEAVMKVFYDTDAREFISGYVESGEEYEFSERVKNPDYGKNLLDSPLLRMSEGGPVAGPTLISKTYSTGFGPGSFIRGVATTIGVGVIVASEVLSAGQGCDRKTMLISRWGGLALTASATVASVLLAPATGGATASFTVGNAIRAAGMFVLISGIFAAIDNAAARYFNNDIINDEMAQSPLERGAAVWTGVASLNSEHSQQRGMMPGNTDQIIAYQQQQNIARQEVIALERQKSNFFDIKNPYSTTGSIALAAHESISSSSISSLASIPLGVSSFIRKGVTSILSPNSVNAASLDRTRFEQCDDEDYLDIGINADVQCNVRFVMPPESMQWDPLDTAQWMESNGYVEEDTTTGHPEGYTPPDPSQNQSFAEQIITDVVNDFYRTRDYKNDFGRFLDFCVYRAMPFGKTYDDLGAFNSPGDDWVSGKKCLITKAGDHGADAAEAEKINRFRAYVFDMSVNDDLDESPIVESASGDGGGARLSESQLLELIKEYGLPDPTAEGVDGWEQKLSQLTDNPKASWAAESLLAAEKNFMDRGGDLKEYLTTAWIWFENGGSAWPDPYQINCDDDRGFNHEVSELCTPHNDVNLQVSGYRPVEKQDKYMEIYDMFYTESELPSILEKVLSNSHNARLEKWNYNDPDQRGKGLVKDHLRDISGATTSQITPNATDFFDPETQFLTLMLGKDPNMTIGMNSFAVSDHDLLAHIGEGEGCGPSWGSYICKPERQLLSNMIYALWKYDSQFGGPSGGSGSGAVNLETKDGKTYARSGIWGGKSMVVSQPNNYTGDWVQKNAKMYAYSIPLVGYLAHPGTDIAMDVGTQLFSPVDGEVVIAGESGYYLHDGGTGGELRIKRDNGDLVILGHMSKITVKVGQRVTVGQPVGKSGTAGSGPHLHLEYRTHRPDGSEKSVDPVEYL